MGQYIATHEFYYAYTDEPHATRRKEILSEFTKLFELNLILIV